MRLQVWLISGMDIESKQATKLLAAIIECNEKLKAMAKDFESRPEVSKVYHEFEWNKNGDFIESGAWPTYWVDGYVDVSLRNGHSIWWEINVEWDAEKWIFEASVNLPGEYGPNTLKEFPDRVAHTIDDFIVQLEEGMKGLTGSANLIETQM